MRMPPLNVCGTSDTAVVRDLRSHLQMFDRRFDPATLGSKARLRIASSVAEGVLAWWHEHEIFEPLAGWDRRLIERQVRSRVSGLITSLLFSWLAELVVRLLLEWLWSPRSELYRLKAYAARRERR